MNGISVPLFIKRKRKIKTILKREIYQYTNDSNYNKVELLRSGKPCYPRMINNLCEFKPRSDFIFDLILKEHALGQKILILSDRRDYLSKTVDALNDKIDGVAGLYVGGMRASGLQCSQEKDIILGTFSMASERDGYSKIKYDRSCFS